MVVKLFTTVCMGCSLSKLYVCMYVRMRTNLGNEIEVHVGGLVAAGKYAVVCSPNSSIQRSQEDEVRIYQRDDGLGAHLALGAL